MSWPGFRLFRRARPEAPQPAAPVVTDTESSPAPEPGDEKVAEGTPSFGARCEAVLACAPAALLERAGAGLAELGVFLDVDADGGAGLGPLVEEVSREEGAAGTLEGPEPEPAERPEPVGPPVDEREVELERLRQALEESLARTDALDRELRGLRDEGAARAAECHELREEREQRASELAARSEEVEAERRRATEAETGRERLASELAAARTDLEAARTELETVHAELGTARAELEAANDERARLSESDARLRAEVAEWVLRLFQANDDKQAAPRGKDLDELIDLGRGKLDQLAAEVRWRRLEMSEVCAAFEQRVWRMVGGPVRRVRAWSAGEAPASAELEGPGGAS